MPTFELDMKCHTYRFQSVEVKQRLQLLLDAKMTIDEALQIRHASVEDITENQYH